MREIKFRAWDKKEKHFVTDGFIIDHRGDEIGEFSYRSQSYVWNDTESNYILMQYTGLKDKNGVEIYESDLVRISWQEGGNKGKRFAKSVVHKVEFLQTGYGNIFENPDGYYKIEVIGNTHENPELDQGG